MSILPVSKLQVSVDTVYGHMPSNLSQQADRGWVVNELNDSLRPMQLSYTLFPQPVFTSIPSSCRKYLTINQPQRLRLLFEKSFLMKYRKSLHDFYS